MKNIILIILLALIGCSSSEDNNVPNNSDELEGTWSLKSYQEFITQPYNYSNDEIVWNFNGNGVVTIAIDNQAVVHPNMHLQVSGNYTYSIPNSNIIQISTVPQTLTYDITGNTLKIIHSHPSDDHSYWFTFEKIQN